MRTLPLSFLLAFTLSLAAAADTQWVKPSGEVKLNTTTVRFDTDVVEGPTVSMRRRKDDSWGGTLRGQATDVRVEGSRLTGSALKGELARTKDSLRMEGLWNGTKFRFELTATKLVVRLGDSAADYLRQPDGTLRPESMAQGREGRLTGSAAGLDAPVPQLLLALLAAGDSPGIGVR